ncbi:MAG: DUF1127 domain-containing protein [Pseudomonadota bacterium]
MALLDQTRSTRSGTDIGGGTGVLSNLIAAFNAWNDARITRKALAQLSDRELEDIGLVRGDIDRIQF